MKANIVTIGDEILIGQIVDTNSSWLARELNNIGIAVHRHISVSDNHQEILLVLKECEATTDFTFVTGGLGPTRDDITKNVLAEYFGGRLYEHEETIMHIERMFNQRNMPVNEMNRSQAMVPESCMVLKNVEGTAPGMWFEKNRHVCISMPGVPYEMQSIFLKEAVPLIQKKFDLPFILHRTILTQGVPESLLAEKIETWENKLPPDIKLAYLPSPGLVRLRLSTSGKNKQDLEKSLTEKVESLIPLIQSYVFGYDDDTLESVLGKLLLEKSLTVSTAESCTGGAIAAGLTSVPGSSQYFMGSLVAYNNMIKINNLKVDGEDIVKFGAVSQNVVEQMALGAMKMFGTHCAIATSGIAGPTGGTPEKPVGTVWIALAYGEKMVSKKFQFGEHRGRNINRSVSTSLNMLRKMVVEDL